MALAAGRHWQYNMSSTTNEYRAIDVRRWRRDGLLDPCQSYGWQWSREGEVVASIRVHTEPGRVILSYRQRVCGEDWKDESYPIYLDWTPCHLGGDRPWFLCPAVGCGRRVAILYGGKFFACRNCLRLAYPSQRESRDERAMRKADRIREKLGWERGIANAPGWKPKGMHWRTFEQLTARHDAFVRISLVGISRRFGGLV